MSSTSAIATIPSKQHQTANLSSCILCQKNVKEKHLVKIPNLSSIEKLVNACKVRHTHHDETVQILYDIITSLSEDSLASIVYHKECYTAITNVKTIDQIIKRYQSAIINSPDCIKRKSGRPQLTTSHDDSAGSSCGRRSSLVPYDKESCIICQTPGGRIHKVEYMRTGGKMLEVAKRLSDKSFYLRLNTIPNAADAVANDVCYHLKCWVNVQRKAYPNRNDIQETSDFNRVACDIELISYVKFMLHRTCIVDMNTLNNRYKESLLENGVKEEDLKSNYKPYIKQIILENVSAAEFIKSPRRNEPERICSRKTNEDIVDAAVKQNTHEDLQEVQEVAAMVRKELLTMKNWHFEGSFNDFSVPKYLSLLIKWILIGPEKILSDEERMGSVNRDVSIICQLIQKAMKTKRQVDYQATSTFTKGVYQTTETPLSVGLGLHVYTKTRSKELVDMLSELHLSIPYKKVLSIKNDLVANAKQKIRSNSGVYVPPVISPNKPLFFAIDNIDLTIDTPDGKDQLHGTTQVIFQEKDLNFEPADENIERGKVRDTKLLYNVMHCCEPNPLNETYPSYGEIVSIQEADIFRKWDFSWALARVFDKEKSIPTWAALNSLCSEAIFLTNCCTTPIIHGSPTDWSNLYTALKIVQGINVSNTSDQKTIVSLDLQLYSKCIQLQSNEYIRYHYIFRLGELHILFAMLKVIGKNINQSGLDEALIEAGVYGPNTMEQIKNGKHYKRNFNAFLTIYLALFDMYAREALSENVVIKVAAQEAVSNLTESDTWNLKSFVEELNEIDLFSVMKKFDKQLKGQAKIFRNYMNLVETMLLFVRASRQGLWELHLASLEMFTKFFFAYDQINYARLSPVYLSEMYALKQNDARSWEFFKSGNFSVNKSMVPFCALGTDHALEQENKKMKVLGGISGIANKKFTMESYFIAAPMLNRVCENIVSTFTGYRIDKKQHHQLAGSISSRCYNDVSKLITVYENHEVDFSNTDDVFNIVTKVVLPPSKASIFLAHDYIGEELYIKFKEERLQGDRSVWDPMKKRKMPTFADTSKSFKTKVDDKIVEIKEEKRLLAKFVIASRRRDDIDLPAYFGRFEFTVVPRSMFRQDGSLLLGTDKATVMHEIENMIPGNNGDHHHQTSGNTIPQQKVVIFDGMAVVNRIKKTQDIETCKDLAASFTQIVLYEAKDYEEIRMIFDRYQENSIKDQTRNKRTQGTHIRYKIADDTKIQGVSMKKLLSHVATKQELTKFLGDHLVKDLEKVGRR